MRAQGGGRACGECDEKNKEKKKSNTWKYEDIRAYFGTSAVGNNERSRLRAEIEAKRKAIAVRPIFCFSLSHVDDISEGRSQIKSLQRNYDRSVPSSATLDPSCPSA